MLPHSLLVVIVAVVFVFVVVDVVVMSFLQRLVKPFVR